MRSRFLKASIEAQAPRSDQPWHDPDLIAEQKEIELEIANKTNEIAAAWQ